MATRRSTKWIVGGAVGLTALVAAAGIAVAGPGNDDQPLTGATLDRAEAAALQATGGGTVTETEAGDDGAAYGVEIRRADGSEVEVSIDGDFNVIRQEADDDGSSGTDGPDDHDLDDHGPDNGDNNDDNGDHDD